MNTIQVKPHPSVDPKAWPLLVHPVSGGLLDASKQVPADGRPWLYDGFTCRMLTDGAIVREGDPGFATPAAAPESAPAAAAAAASAGPAAAPAPAPAATATMTSDPAH